MSERAEQENPTSPPPIVFVRWRDSYLASEGWTSREESIESGRAMTSEPIYSAGFLIDDTDTGIIVASGFNHHADDVEGAVAIPRSAIETIEEVWSMTEQSGTVTPDPGKGEPR